MERRDPPDDFGARIVPERPGARGVVGGDFWSVLSGFAKAHARLLLCLLAFMPFLPGARQILVEGVPEVLVTGDAATLELRILHAGQGKQLLGPYSRFLWSHPGPAMFYLALPFYEILHRRGPAVNVFVFVASLGCAVSLVLSARKLRGSFFAVLVALLLGVYLLVGVPFAMSSGWNPSVPMLPLALLMMLGARLAVGSSPAVLLAFVFLASAIVQTHVGYLAAVLAVSAVAATGTAGRWLWPSATPGAAGAWRRRAWAGLAAVALFVACWAPPLIEQATVHPGNLSELFGFFTRPHRADHSWAAAFVEVLRKLAVMPLALGRIFHSFALPDGPPLSWPTVQWLGWAQLALLLGSSLVAVRRRDPVLGVLAALSAGCFLAAISAVREIRGQFYPYLLEWISTIGFLVASLGAACLDRAWARSGFSRWGAGAVAGVLFVGLSVAVGDAFGKAQIFPPHDLPAEQLAQGVERGLAARPQVRRPVVHIVSPDVWPVGLAVVLHLEKAGIRVAVDRRWLYMVGSSLADHPADLYGLTFGDASFHALARTRLDQTLLASAGGVYAYLQDTQYIEGHRVLPDPGAVSALGVRGALGVVTDGVVPVEGAAWDSPATVVLGSLGSALVVAIPTRADLVGVYLSTDGNDVYSIRCVGLEGLTWLVGPTRPEEAEAGMRTHMIFSDALGSCRSIELSAASGDGAYSVGELGFLHR